MLSFRSPSASSFISTKTPPNKEIRSELTPIASLALGTAQSLGRSAGLGFRLFMPFLGLPLRSHLAQANHLTSATKQPLYFHRPKPCLYCYLEDIAAGRPLSVFFDNE